MHGLRSALRSVPTTVRLARAGRLVRSRARLGERLVMEDGREFMTFRETIATPKDGSGPPAVLVVRFRFRVPGPFQTTLHALFRHLCVVTTPFFAGIPGFRVKVWQFHEAENDYQGIYEWATRAQALEYAESLLRLLRRLSVAGSCRYELHAGRSLAEYRAELSAAGQGMGRADRRRHRSSGDAARHRASVVARAGGSAATRAAENADPAPVAVPSPSPPTR